MEMGKEERKHAQGPGRCFVLLEGMELAEG